MDMTPPPGLRPTVDSDGDSHCDGDVRASLSLALRRIDLLARNEHLCRAGSFELLWPDTVLWQLRRRLVVAAVQARRPSLLTRSVAKKRVARRANSA